MPTSRDIVLVREGLTPEQPWHRQPGEPGDAFDTFRRYYQAGPMRKLYTLPGVKFQQAREWHDEWTWAARVEAYDRHMQTIEDAEGARALAFEARTRATMAAELRHNTLKLALSQSQKMLALDALPEFAQQPIMKQADFNKFLAQVLETARLESGQSTANVAVAVGVAPDLSRLTDDELETLRALREKL